MVYFFYYNPLLIIANTFSYTYRYGNFAVPVKIFFINDNDNRCISGVFGWEFNLILSKVFVTCVRQLNTIFVFIYLFMNSRTSPGEVVFGVVPGINVTLCSR